MEINPFYRISSQHRILLLQAIRDEQVDILPLVQQQHGAEVADPLVCEPRAGRQLKALQLAKVSRIAEHVYVKQLGNIPTAIPTRVHRISLRKQQMGRGSKLTARRSPPRGTCSVCRRTLC